MIYQRDEIDISQVDSLSIHSVSRINKCKTLRSRDIQTATRLVISGELCKHAVAEANKAITKYVAGK